MSRNTSTGERLKGVYLRGKKYWYRYSFQGRQYGVPLDTENESEALSKAMRTHTTVCVYGWQSTSRKFNPGRFTTLTLTGLLEL